MPFLNQHNTHVYNSTKETILIVLTDTDNRRTDQIVLSGETICISTPRGRNTISVMKKLGNDAFDTRSSATYTDDSDYSFIVKERDGFISVVRAKYLTTTEEVGGIR